MKKIITVFVLLSLLLGLSSCKNEPDAYELLSDFVNSYGAEGIIYSPLISEGEKGYMPSGMVERIYIFCGNLPRNFAVFLNSHADSRSECGVFVCSDAAQCQIVEEACLERIELLGQGSEVAFVKRTDNVVFYSTMTDRKRAEQLWREIIR